MNMCDPFYILHSLTIHDTGALHPFKRGNWECVNVDDAFSRNVINKVDGFAGEESLSSMLYLLQAMFVEMDSHANKLVFSVFR